MTEKISRRDFLKLVGVGAATTAVLTGCGPASKYVTREPYFKMPEYTYNGQSTYFATTCRECSAACGMVVRTFQGRALKLEGNASHPVNIGKTCARGQVSLEGLYNPDRVTDPVKQARGAQLSNATMKWDDAVTTVADLLTKNKPEEIAFLMGLVPDHLFDLVSDLTAGLGAPAPVRFGALGMFESRATLSKASEDLFGQAALPFFDLSFADVVFSFGANFLETWLSPVAYTREFSEMRKGTNGKRGYLIQFEAHMSSTAATADEWIPAKPGTEGLVALAIGNLVAQARGGTMPDAFANVDVQAVASASDVSVDTLKRLADLFTKAGHPLAMVGGAALGQTNGLANAKAVLALNALVENLGVPGGLYLSPLAPEVDAYHGPASAQEMSDFIKKLASGNVKVLFVHGVNPIFELPKSFGFAEALKKVETVVSFATFPDETALMADYIFPDHHWLESFGYQRVVTGAEQPTLAGAQPVVSPFCNTHATADVLLAAAAKVGGNLATALPYTDEFAFIQGKIQPLVSASNGNFTAPEINTFMAFFQQHGGWWITDDMLIVPKPSIGAVDVKDAAFTDGDFFLVPFVSPTLAEAGANKPWLQEAPDPTTTVMWNTWVAVNPTTAAKLGIDNDDVIRIVSAAGTLEVSVYKYPAIRPDTIAIPFGQGHSAYGQFATTKDDKGNVIPRGVNPFDLLGVAFNEAGDLAFAGVKVKIEKTGKTQVLSRLESKIGVYGEGLGG
jgi:anaerobic selenocysteine-containing dehydrogenase